MRPGLLDLHGASSGALDLRGVIPCNAGSGVAKTPQAQFPELATKTVRVDEHT